MYNSSSHNTNRLVITDALSFNCNLKCIYCMQQNTFKNVKMLTPEEKVDLWRKLLELYHCDELDIYLFGGEPFFNISYVERLLELATLNRLPIVNYSAVTNGTIVNDRVINVLNNYNFKNLQITIDGTEKIHNSRRIGVVNGWNKTIENIKRLLKETNVRITINTVMDVNNSEDYLNMVDLLIEEFKEYVYASDCRIVFKLGMECHPQFKSEYTNNSIIDEIEYNKIYLKLLNKLVNKNVFISSFMPDGICISKSEKEIVLGPDGNIYKCIAGLGMSKFKISNYDEIYYNPLKMFVESSKYLSNLHEDCNKCDFLNLCNGGCKYAAYIEDKEKICRIRFFNELLPEFIKLQSKLVEVSPYIYKKGN